MPTEEEIAEKCLEIQSGWTVSEETHRRVISNGEAEMDIPVKMHWWVCRTN
jgi:hypothetical protein